MQVNARDVLVIFPTRDSQLFSSLHHSLSKSIVKEIHFRRFLKKHKLNLELTLKKLSATQASIQSFPGEEEDRTENIAVEIQPILRPI